MTAPLGLVCKATEHGPANGGTNAVASNDEVTCRRCAVLEGERDRVGWRRLGVRSEALGEVDPVPGVEILGEELLQDRPVERVRYRRRTKRPPELGWCCPMERHGTKTPTLVIALEVDSFSFIPLAEPERWKD